MDEKQFLENVYLICDDVLKNASHSFGLHFLEINETLIEVRKRYYMMYQTDIDKAVKPRQ